MKGKYTHPIRYAAAWAKWAAVRRVLASMSHWSPIQTPLHGYSIVIGCPARLLSILGANLKLLSRQDLTGCHEVICVVDAPREQVGGDAFERPLLDRFSQIGEPAAAGGGSGDQEPAKLRLLYYTPREYAVLDRLGYPAGFCWFSWQKGLATVRTRHTLLHDFDAFPLRPSLLRERYETTLATNAAWLGQRCYQGNGVERADGLVTTFEMVLDSAAVRQRLRPIDLFNRVTRYKGRTVEFDITLEVQALGLIGPSHALDVPEEEMVHPSQVVHQFTELTHIRNYIPPARNRLPFIPYLLDVAGDAGVLGRACEELRASDAFTLGGKSVHLHTTDPDHIIWLDKQAGVMDRALFGHVRTEVGSYFAAVHDAVARAKSKANQATAAIGGERCDTTATSGRERQPSCSIPTAQRAT
jgi:hypothetical protein